MNSNDEDNITVELPNISPPSSAREFATLPRSRFSFAGFFSMLEDEENASEFPPPPDYTPLSPNSLSPTDVRINNNGHL